MQEFNEWKIFDKHEYDLLKDFDYKNFSRIGYVYLLEYGKYVKIGTTKEPYSRIRNLSSLGRDYAEVSTGRVAISPTHINRNENEKILHKLFSESRVKNGELFSISLDFALSEISKNPISYITEDTTNRNKKDENYLIKMFAGSRNGLPKGKTRFPMYTCWEEEFEDRLFILSLKSRKQKSTLKEEVLCCIENAEKFDDFKAIYKKDMNCKDSDTMGMIEYFPELARMADAYLDKLEEVTEKQLNKDE